MINFLKQIWWMLNDRCLNCGSELEIWDDKHSSCPKCGRV